MSNDELLALACEFDLGPEPIIMGRLTEGRADPYHRVTVKNVGNPDDGPDRWAILQRAGNSCLCKSGEWEYQPLPSSRTDDFYLRCRYDSVREAITYYRRWAGAVRAWATEALKEGRGRGKDGNVVEVSDVPVELLSYEALMK